METVEVKMCGLSFPGFFFGNNFMHSTPSYASTHRDTHVNMDMDMDMDMGQRNVQEEGIGPKHKEISAQCPAHERPPECMPMRVLQQLLRLIPGL